MRGIRHSRMFASALLLVFASSPVLAVPVVSGGYEVSLFASGIGATAGMRAGADGLLYVADYGIGRVLAIDASGTTTVLATGIAFVTDIAWTDSGRLFAASATGANSAIVEISGAGATTLATGFSYPTSVAARGDSLYVANSGAGSISRMDPNGTTTIAISGLSAPNGPFGLAFDASGSLYYIDHGTGGVFRSDLVGGSSQIGSVSPLGGTFLGFGFDSDLFVSDVNAGELYRLRADGTTEVFASGFAAKGAPPVIGPQGIAYSHGAMFIADGDVVWKITRLAAVPEPPAVLLLLAGLAVLSVARPRQRARSESL